MNKRKYTAVQRILAVLAGFFLLSVLFLTSFRITVFNPSFAHRELEKYHVAQNTGVSQEEINALFDRLLDYLSGKEESMQMNITERGVYHEAYSEKELQHMVDVKGLFDGGFRILYIALGITAVLLLYFIFGRDRNGRIYKALFPGFLIASILFVILAGVLGGALALNFDKAFIQFHEMFFSNDLWILSYETDILMNIVPESYSYDVAFRTVLQFVAVLIPLIVLSFIGWKRKRVKA